jgi:hypothetical protein
MPLQKLELRPGINKESTTYANEGGFYDCDKIRFRSGYAEKLGGWISISGNTFKGMAHSIWNWIASSVTSLLGFGTNQKYYIESSGIYHDITPLNHTLALPNNPFATTSGSLLVTVTTSAPHGATIGTYVTFSGSTAVAGITLNGEFEIITVPTDTTFTIIGNVPASATTSGGGAAVSAEFQLNAGNAAFVGGVGWGGPPWNTGGWGSSTPVGIDLRLWSQDNFNDDLIMAIRGGNIYYWTLDLVNFNRATTLQAKADTVVKFTTDATFGLGDTTIYVTDSSGITSGAVVTGTGMSADTYVTQNYVPGSLEIPISAPTTAPSSGAYDFSYAGRHVPTTTNQILTSSVGNFTIAIGATPYDPTSFNTTFNPLMIRWSDADNAYEWVPSTTNQSGEQLLSLGSYAVAAFDTRQEILIWTDAGLFSMQYLGPPYIWGFNLLMDNVSIISPNSAIAVNNVTYWMGVDKFYMYSGRVETLPCTVRQYVFADINRSQINQIICGTNEGFNEVWWFYPSADSNVNNRYVIYNHLERIWYVGSMDRSAWIDSPGGHQNPVAAFSLQASYVGDQTSINGSPANANMTATATSIILIDATSYPNSGTIMIGSEKITYASKNGNTLLGCVRGAGGTTAATHLQYSSVSYSVFNQLMDQEQGNDDVTTDTALPIEAYIETSDFDIGDGHNFGYVWRMLPDLNFNGSSVTNPEVVLTVKGRQNSGTAYATADEPTVTRTQQYPIELYTGQVYTRVRGRQMAFRVDSTAIGTAWQMGAMRIDIRPDGKR